MLTEALKIEREEQAASLPAVFWRSLRRPFVSMMLLAGAILFAGLGQGDIRIDGPIYAWVAKRMVISGDWLNLYYDHGQTPYFNKPPLQFWLMAIVFKVFGYSTFSAKLVSVLFGLGCIAMVYAIARLRFEAPLAATAGLALATTYSFVRNTASVRLDAGVTLFFLVAIYAGARMLLSPQQRTWYWVALGAACGLALMVKSGTALLCLPILVAASAWNRRWDLLLNWRLFAAIAVCAVIVLPWYLHQYHTWGQAFIDQHFRNQMLGRFEASTFGTSAWYAYLQDLTTRYWPWFPLLVLGTWRMMRNQVTAPFDRLLLLWGFGTLVVLHLVPKKYDRYLLLVYPALAVFAAYGLGGTRFWDAWKTRVLPHVGWAAVILTLALQLFGVRLHSRAYPELAQALPIIQQANNATIYVIESVPIAMKCSIQFFSNAKVESVRFRRVNKLAPDSVVVLPRKFEMMVLPPHRVLSEGKHVRFVLLTAL